MSSSSASESRVQKITVLEGLPRRDEAMALLQRLAKDCAPIMTRRGWTVSHLKEFYPKDDGLLGLNVNRGNHFLHMNTTKYLVHIRRLLSSCFLCDRKGPLFL